LIPVRFPFAIPIPSTLAPRDWHPNGVVQNSLYAELRGGSLPSTSPPQPPPFLSRFNPFAPPRASIPLPAPPAYDDSQSKGLLLGIHKAERTIRLVYNPDPLGYVNTLSEQAIGESPDIGAYDIRLFSDVVSSNPFSSHYQHGRPQWTISAPVRASLALVDIPTTTTIFSFNASILQTHTFLSPTAPTGTKPLITQRRFSTQKGTTPEKHRQFPDPTFPALWRGKGAGGADDGVLLVEIRDRLLENDDVLRPSTLSR
jgi:hypothetical protein